MKRERIFFGVVVSVVFVFLFACSGCATDFKLAGPTFSWRSGAGGGPAEVIASHPLGRSITSMGSSSAASVDPIND